MTPIAGPGLLAQYLIECPDCGSAAAVHVSGDNTGKPVLVRVVCARSCPDTNLLRAKVIETLFPIPAVA